jgi:hypothetical protein
MLGHYWIPLAISHVDPPFTSSPLRCVIMNFSDFPSLFWFLRDSTLTFFPTISPTMIIFVQGIAIYFYLSYPKTGHSISARMDEKIAQLQS